MSGKEDTVTDERTCSSCGESACSAKSKKPNESDRDLAQRQAVARRMCRIGHKIFVLSGKGGVGKSTVAVNIAAALALEGKRVGLMDIDIHGPSVPKLLNIKSAEIVGSDDSIRPATAFEGLKVMSIGFLLPNDDDPVIWRGPRKFGLIRQFLADVEWGELDYLIVDSPPGTGDEPLAVAELVGQGHVDGAVVVTTPQEVSTDDVRRSIRFCSTLSVPVLGVVENMAGFVCPHCGERCDVFKRGGGEVMADQMGVPYLGGIPLDPAVVEACDDGEPFIKRCAGGESASAFRQIIQPLLDLKGKEDQ